MSKLNHNNKFYLVVGTKDCVHHSLFDTVAMGIANGVDMIQLREKNSTTKEIVQIAGKIQPFLRKRNIPLIINDDIEAAKILDADGVHLGQQDIAYEAARKYLGKDKIIGLSVENIIQAEKINQYHNLDYIGAGPVFATNTKKDATKPIGIDGLIKIKNAVKYVPIYAIGGINLQNIEDIMQAGIQGAAVISAVCSAEDPVAICELFSRKIR